MQFLYSNPKAAVPVAEGATGCLNMRAASGYKTRETPASDPRWPQLSGTSSLHQNELLPKNPTGILNSRTALNFTEM